MTNELIIGWSEQVVLPKRGTDSIRAKVDTGARSCALHVENIRRARSGWVTFDVVVRQKKQSRLKTVRARVVKWARVRSSTGEYTEP